MKYVFLLLVGLNAFAATGQQRETGSCDCTVLRIYQLNWYYTPRHPMTVERLLAPERKARSETRTDPQQICYGKALLAHKRTGRLPANDIRLVAIFDCGGLPDTLVVDGQGRCRFQNMTFALNHKMARYFNVAQVVLNPDERKRAQRHKTAW